MIASWDGPRPCFPGCRRRWSSRRSPSLLDRHDVSLPDLIQSALKDPLDLAQRLGARAISVVGKRKLAAAGNALDTELAALATYMHSLDPGLGRAADVSSSKMRYQMNRMRRLAANYELRREHSLSRDAGLIALNLFPMIATPRSGFSGAVWLPFPLRGRPLPNCWWSKPASNAQATKPSGSKPNFRESTGAPRSPKRTWDENDGRSPTTAFAPSTEAKVQRACPELVERGRLA